MGAPASPSGSRATHETPSGSHPAGFDPSRSVAQRYYEERPDIFYTGELDEKGDELTRPVAWDELSDERKTEISRIAELNSKTVAQISNVMSAMAPLIEMYSDNVARAEERYQKERAFLADMMAEYLRLSHFIASKAAKALEDSTASSFGPALSSCGPSPSVLALRVSIADAHTSSTKENG
jgi:hypothetical protein